jgi:hypothetical protein
MTPLAPPGRQEVLVMRYAHASPIGAVAALYVSAMACGANVVVDGHGTTGTGGTGTSATSAVTGTSSGSTCTGPTGDCMTDADCGSGACAPVTPGGYRVCLEMPPEATSCSPPLNGTTQCCKSADCKQGKCYSTKSVPRCAGPAQIYNECAVDTCTSDAQCANELFPPICIPAGAFGYPTRTCFAAYCHTDADCTAQPCGVCAPITGPCCSFPAGLACVYPGGCTKNADCGPNKACMINPMTRSSECTYPPPCPP